MINSERDISDQQCDSCLKLRIQMWTLTCRKSTSVCVSLHTFSEVQCVQEGTLSKAVSDPF